MDRESQILNIRYKDTAQRLTDTNEELDPISTKRFHKRLWDCLTSDEYLKNYKMGPILIALHPTTVGTGEDILDPKAFGNLLSSGLTKVSNIFIVDYKGKRIENPINVLIQNPAVASQYFSESNATVFFIEGNRINIYFKTKCVDCIPDIQAHDDAVKISSATLPVMKYKNLIDSHFEEKVENKTILCYWKNKSKRLLVASPEDIFGNDLAYYLDQYISDGRVDQECRTLWTNNRTDIRVIRNMDGKLFIFEIKWLGKSETCSYDGNNAVERVNSGLAQLVDYIKAEKQSICGALIIYDARIENNNVKWNVKIQQMDARIKDPIRYYLLSESASTKGDRIAKKVSKK